MEKIIKELSDEVYSLHKDFEDFALNVFRTLSDFKAKHKNIMDKVLDLEIKLNTPKPY